MGVGVVEHEVGGDRRLRLGDPVADVVEDLEPVGGPSPWRVVRSAAVRPGAESPLLQTYMSGPRWHGAMTSCAATARPPGTSEGAAQRSQLAMSLVYRSAVDRSSPVA
jgi:hypothetical protein